MDQANEWDRAWRGPTRTEPALCKFTLQNKEVGSLDRISPCKTLTSPVYISGGWGAPRASDLNSSRKEQLSVVTIIVVIVIPHMRNPHVGIPKLSYLGAQDTG